MATTNLTATKMTSDRLEGLGMRTATCTAQPSQGKFDDTGCKANPDGLVSPTGISELKDPIF